MVKVKIKTNKRLYEAFSSHTVELGAKIKTKEERQRELSGLWGKLIKKKKLDLRKLYKKGTMAGMGYQIPLAKMNVPIKVKVKDAITGSEHEEEIVPAQVASFCEMARTAAMATKELGPILGRFPKPVIWTFKVDTAASDGVRIAFNPIFAQQLLYQGKQQVKDLLAAGKRMNGNERIIQMARLFLYVLTHEAYHQIYRHREQAERKKETEGGRNHTLANIAMDAEINRDIEKQLPQWYAGATEEAGGIFDTRFKMQPWQDIFDAYFYDKMQPPQQTNPNPINNSMGQQSQQNATSNSQESDDNNSGDSGDNSNDNNQSSSNNSQQQNNQSNSQQQQGQQQQGGQSDDQQSIKDGQPGQQQSQQSAGQNNDNSQSGQYDDTDLSAADEDTMSEYDEDMEIPDISDKSGEYQDAYADELRKELDKALGRNKNGEDSNSDGEGSDENSGSNSQSGDTDDSGENGNDSDSQDGMSTDGNMDGEQIDGNGQGGQPTNNQSNQQGNGQNNQGNQSGNQQGNGTDSNGTDSGFDNSLNQKNKNNGDPGGDPGTQDPGGNPGGDPGGDPGTQDPGGNPGGDPGKEGGSGSSPIPPMSKEQRAAREQARKDVRKIIDAIKQQVDAQMNQIPDDEELAKELEGKTFDTETSSTFGGGDMLTQEEMAQLAADAGNPYTAEELTVDIDELSKKYNKENIEKLKAISPELSNKLTDIENRLKALESLANWQQKLKNHFHDAMEAGTEAKRSKRAMSQTWRDDRFNPYKEVEHVEDKAANIFYLMDNSGSMYWYGGNDIFYTIFKQIFDIEKKCHVKMSARAYFADRPLSSKDVAMWTEKTPVQKRIDLLSDRGGSGGTDIPGNVLCVTRLNKPYYYNNGDHHTMIICFTDGENNDPRGWALLKLIPAKIRKDLVFVIINNRMGVMDAIRQITANGVQLKNVIGIDADAVKKQSR